VQRALVLASLAIFFPAIALAKDALKLDLVPKAQKGQGSPELVVRAESGLKKITLDVKRSTDGKRIKLDAGPVHAGREHRFPLELKAIGEARFEGTLSVLTDSGETGEMPIDVKAELLDPLEVSVKREDVDLEAHRLKLSASRDLKKVEVSVMSDVGTPIGTTSVDAGDKDGALYAIGWKQSKGTVLKISIRAEDQDGFFSGVDLFPWRVDIPHEEVNFRTGSFDIDAEEAPKLDASYKRIQDAIKKYGKLATIRLFIAGHTDTVGTSASNLTLSNNRARAIGNWFKKRGVAIPILCAGFGEDLLLVKTPDETDEAKNRRAEYIVAVDPPPMPGKFAPL
jgi:outer membrane protein OmpA-like peptidoglycan-associated protein